MNIDLINLKFFEINQKFYKFYFFYIYIYEFRKKKKIIYRFFILYALNIPYDMNSSSFPFVNTFCPFLPITIAVPVS